MVAKLVELEFRRDNELRLLHLVQVAAEFRGDPGFDQGLLLINSHVVARLKVADEVDTGPQASTGQVAGVVFGLKSLGDEEIKLGFPDPPPNATAVSAFPAPSDPPRPLRNRFPPAGRWPSPGLPATARDPGILLRTFLRVRHI